MVSERSWSKQQIGTSSLRREDERLQCCSRGELRIISKLYTRPSMEIQQRTSDETEAKPTFESPCKTGSYK
ncbi:hypothetical protein T12_869 [Trichinella patagoniensis]|uniref:Uncharacterized protein n=1 Tax=Trichinella patagoniensis TaxID=990121 RepID=A0A0V0Z2B6_9BILA|nr:hypothetical protein T12_869 [Trichinella patagoniensis]